MSDTSCEYLLPLEVADKPGVLHAVTGVFARHDVSIRAAEQDGIGDGARLVFLTHNAHEAAMQACISELKKLDVVTHVGGLLRVIAD
jgi:homoserine dehydrogenase